MFCLTSDTTCTIASFLSSPGAMSLMATCRYTKEILDTREFWKPRAVSSLLRLQRCQTNTFISPIDWEHLLRMGDMSPLQLRRASVQASWKVMSPKAFSDILCVIMILLDHQKPTRMCDDFCLHLMRKWPHAYLYSDWMQFSNNGPVCQVTLTTSKARRGKCDVIILGDVSELPRALPDALSVTATVMHGEAQLCHPSARFGVLFNEDTIHSVPDHKSTSKICLALCMYMMKGQVFAGPTYPLVGHDVGKPAVQAR